MLKNEERKESFYTVYGWMPKLGLRGAALSVYAVIYGFTKQGRTYRGSCGALAERFGLTRGTVSLALRSLEKRGFIKRMGEARSERGFAFPEYVALKDGNDCTKIEQGVYENRTGGVEKPYTIEKKINTEEMIINNSSSGGLTEREKGPEGV